VSVTPGIVNGITELALWVSDLDAAIACYYEDGETGRRGELASFAMSYRCY